jgi:HEAT repeat protein
MKSRLLTALVLTASLERPCAAELTEPEKAWAELCMENLASPSDRVREGAEAALSRIGVEAVPIVLSNLAKLETDAHWAALERALAGMGRREAADALWGGSPAWPETALPRLQAIVERLRADPKRDDDDVALRVREILATFDEEMSYSSDEPRVRKIVALGRRAVPTLLEEVRSQHVFSTGYRSTAAADAMAMLATDEDVPALAGLLGDGHLLAARCFRGLHGPKAVDALLAPLEKGFLQYDLLEALARHRKDERVRSALRKWLERFGRGGEYAVGQAAEFLADSRDEAAVPLLVPLLDLPLETGVRMRVARALVRLGEKSGIPVLIEVVEEVVGHYAWERDQAGKALNDVVGEDVYTGNFVRGRQTGNVREAAKRFREWWEASKDRVRFDRKRRAWRVD